MLQRFAADEMTAFANASAIREALADERVPVGSRHRVLLLLVVVDQAEILHRLLRTMACSAGAGTRGASATQLAHRPHLDAAMSRGREPGGDLQRIVEVSRFDQEESADLLLRFGEG